MSEPEKIQEEIEQIQELVKAGVLGRELCPEPNYWHWYILKPEELPEKFKFFIPLGEVRW